MPKIRGIKPDYWTDEDVVEMSIPARLLFIGMWNYACDNGHLDDKPKQIKMRIFPADNIDVEPLLEEMVALNRISRADRYITIRKFTEHQRPHKRWFLTCDKPECERPDDDEQPATTGGRAGGKKPSPVAPQVATGGPGGSPADGDGDGDGESDRTRKRATSLPKDWTPTPEHIERAAQDGVDLSREVAKFKLHVEDKGLTSKSWNARFTRWLMNAAEYQQQRNGGRPSGGQRPGEALWDLPPTGTDR